MRISYTSDDVNWMKDESMLVNWSSIDPAKTTSYTTHRILERKIKKTIKRETHVGGSIKRRFVWGTDLEVLKAIDFCDERNNMAVSELHNLKEDESKGETEIETPRQR